MGNFILFIIFLRKSSFWVNTKSIFEYHFFNFPYIRQVPNEGSRAYIWQFLYVPVINTLLSRCSDTFKTETIRSYLAYFRSRIDFLELEPPCHLEQGNYWKIRKSMKRQKVEERQPRLNNYHPTENISESIDYPFTPHVKKIPSNIQDTAD